MIGFQRKVLTLLERQGDEIREIKAAVQSLRSGQSQPLVDYSVIPKHPLLTRDELQETWIKNTEVNRELLVIFFLTRFGKF